MLMKLPFEARERDVIVKQSKKAVGKFGIEPEKRPTEQIIRYGYVNIDKPSGPNSHNVAAFVKKILKIQKTGHSGTLDPMVTGCLPVGLEKATRLNEALLKAGKEYVCIMHVHKELSDKQIKDGLAEFVGKIKQTPPKKSAVKREEREREIYYLKVLEIKGREVLFIVGCEAGTYIRMLCHDFGLKMGCGAHMKELRRTKAGPFKEDTLCTLHDLKDGYVFWKEKNDDSLLRKCILPAEKAVEHLAKVWITDNAIKPVSNGRNVSSEAIMKLNDDIKKGELVAIMSLKGEVIALGPALADTMTIVKGKGLAVKTEKVMADQL
ncbi:RNA-guided pseudouridylation complex pseudouridine synthase subunit Cbf5 [Candidatus Woesearchaeota archaeon]|nr:RNA-guided pseudouridylation complex pseudouridine synthase subunit Cbf5 [Candidatus Woesearchaeota archaeon]